MRNVVIIGGGAAGMMAAISAARNHPEAKVHIYERNEKLGKKLFITGKGRCNLTNASDMDTLFSNVVTNPKFLYSAFYTFDNQQVIDLIEGTGTRTKVERGNRVFPESDKAQDVINALKHLLKAEKVKIHYHEKVSHLLLDETTEEKKIKGIRLEDGTKVLADAVILAAGGKSYQSTGSDGDGYRLAKEAGHEVTEIRPALVPIVLRDESAIRMQGLSLKNVAIRLEAVTGKKKNQILYEDQGEMLFTHFGVSGPLILSASSYLSSYYGKHKDNKVLLKLDLKPALTFEQLDKRLLRDFEENQNRNFSHALDKLLPKKMIPEMITYAGIDPYKKVNLITREERETLCRSMKEWTFHVVSLRGINEAIITQGGINVKEVNASTMESKLVKGLYFAGEILDVDALTGGYNLQIAWSTGWLAGFLES